MSECNCPSGQYGCSCCCASVTGLRAGIHPDYIKSTYLDATLTNEGWVGDGTSTFEIMSFLGEPIHIVSVTAALVTTRRDIDAVDKADMEKQLQEHVTTYKDVTSFYASQEAAANQQMPVSFSLFTIASLDPETYTKGGWNAHDESQDGRTYICTGSLTLQSPSWQNPPDLFGYFCDGGVHLELNAPTNHYGIRIVINYIDRGAFSPAYGDPVKVLQHYWSCAHDAEFLEGFYGGNTFTVNEDPSDVAATRPSSSGTKTYYGQVDATLTDQVLHTEEGDG